MSEASCVLCNEIGGRLIWENSLVRIINAEDPNYPAFTRVVYQKHIKEMSDLTPAQRHELMDFVFLVEKTQRDVLAPDKINLAQFGTMVPHVHWHIIPRFKEDQHYPDAIWSTVNNNLTPEALKAYLEKQQELLPQYETILLDRLKSIHK